MIAIAADEKGGRNLWKEIKKIELNKRSIPCMIDGLGDDSDVIPKPLLVHFAPYIRVFRHRKTNYRTYGID